MRILRYQKIKVLILRTIRETFKALGILKNAYENKQYSVKQENLYDLEQEEEVQKKIILSQKMAEFCKKKK